MPERLLTPIEVKMSLDADYLKYPMRRRGMDHDYYPYSKFPDRDPVQWPGGKTLMVWPVISLEYFPMVPNDDPFRAPGHMQTAYPDYRHYTAREYGTRIGIYRLLDAFEKVGATISVAVNSAIGERYPELVKDIVDAGHEIIAHSTDMNGTIASGMDEARERELIRSSLYTLEKTTGTRPRGWLSIARSQSFNTARLLAEAGVDYMCDWVNDELPYIFTTSAGDIVNIPLNHELSDRQIINVQQQSIDSYTQSIHDAADWLLQEADQHGGRMLPMHLTPYITGLPYRIARFEELVTQLAANSAIGFARGDAIHDAWQRA
ncbi:polysaccharide deacetylase family protein [Alterisphingorhabdus coralli]|uniref:Chitooligosaccharide deacetylase n=1 Tax=Alterisphingorhabdus coralli TaxID=3071408 RepID=A0AA97I233_9SPHN|nr:polysaccharide deacetylase family protein [Parasphingorhabdus sp. SCSIO 66989]WOE75365.1 polysaccharide deacetylase family protein [Parasphingorhabdus sp. SCSIO 66989]